MTTLTFNPPTPGPDAEADVLASVLRDDGVIELWEANFDGSTWWSSNATRILQPVVSWANKPAGVDMRGGVAQAERVKCDGNHGGPRCADPECWNDDVPYTYASTQATTCASCLEHKHTPLRIDAMGGYVCLTCIDQKLGSLLGEFGYPEPDEGSQEEAQQPIALPDFDSLPDEAIDNACTAGALYRADLMSAWESLRSDLKQQQSSECHVVCNNADCTWGGPVSECCMLGAVGPLCPVCRETVHLCGAAQPAQAAQVPEGWRSASNDPPPVGVDVLVAVEFDRPGDWRIKVGGRNPQERTGWCVFGASWVPQVWMPLDVHRAQLTATPAKGATHG